MMLAKCGGASEPVGAGRGRVLTPQDDGGGSAPARPSGNQGPGGFPNNVYALAAAVFRKARMEQEATCGEPGDGRRKDQHLPEVKDEEARRRAYKLAFDTLAYLELLNDIMIDSCFNLLQPLPDDQMSLVMVMLYDLQERKFLPRKRGNSEKDRQLVEVREVEICLYSLRDVCSALERGGFSQVKSIGQLEGPTFCQDPHCPDLLAFRAHLEADLYAARLFGDHKLLVQDKCRSLALSCLRPLLTRSCHVLVAGYLSVSTVTQAAMLASSDSAQVRVCWLGRTPSQREELPDTLASMGCKNVKLVGESFLELDPSDPSVQKVQVILLMPLCSASAVSNPVELLLAEGQELDLLHDLSQETFSQLKLDTLAAGQMRDLTHAMKFPQVRAVLYSTCSTYREENEEVVERALRQGGGSKQRMFRLRPTALSQFSTLVAGKPRHPFLKVDPSKDSNGCFVALLTREVSVRGLLAGGFFCKVTVTGGILVVTAAQLSGFDTKQVAVAAEPSLKVGDASRPRILTERHTAWGLE
ncbi:putative methyltransferase NSUN7 [Scleropages formosus]|uniref:putative methyltransferase NSUN7 n=1 Tax=Scleropages formosus TaxID=113540 RepID=UPI0010FAB47E|nr:putative methyltransferase NSUN7 [Scleropages formosus]